VRSDAELIMAAREDPDLFRFIYDRYAERIHRFFWRRTGNREVALDLMAETFAQAWISKARFRDLAGGSAGPWLFTIARRLLIASVEQRQLEMKALDKLQVEPRPHSIRVPAPTHQWLDGVDADLEEALADLPAEQGQAIVLRVVCGLTYKAIGSRAGCTPTAARIRVSRGLKRLRARLEAN
jgi:RNA polymerase sigma-70 factor (ECF subfamily)